MRMVTSARPHIAFSSATLRMIAQVSPRLHRELVAEAFSFYQARWSPVEEPDVPACGRLIRAAAADGPMGRFCS